MPRKMKKIKRTVLKVTVLSDEDESPGSMDLADIAREMDTGSFVGEFETEKTEIIEGREAIEKACEDVRSEGGFFLWDEED
jgi:hypothetical protein